MPTSEFSVYYYFSDTDYNSECRFVDMTTAVERFKFLTTNVAARTGFTKRVIMTDGDDFCCMEWKHGHGLTFPPELKEKV